jgi:quinol monooxygenase YgiN
VTKVALFIKTKTKSGKRDEARELWEKFLKGRAEANDAQELYFFCNDNNDPDTILLFAVYSDPTALAKNATN